MMNRREFIPCLMLDLGALLSLGRLAWPIASWAEGLPNQRVQNQRKTFPRVELGLSDPQCPSTFASLQEMDRRLGGLVRVVSWYQAWGSQYKVCRPEYILEAHRLDLKPLITWEPWKLPTDLPTGTPPRHQPDFALENIARGRYDDYVRTWARVLAGSGKLIYLRPMHEMNGNWYPWAGMENGNHPAAYIKAWKYLRRVFREEGADNVLWVWCPYAESYPPILENSLERYFPGESEVDWLGIDGYNWGDSRPGSSWQTFTQVFGEAYRRICALARGKPVMIAEVGCSENGDKPGWIRDALQELPEKFPRVKILVWFNIKKECDWRIDSSPQALAAFKEQAGRFLSR